MRIRQAEQFVPRACVNYIAFFRGLLFPILIIVLLLYGPALVSGLLLLLLALLHLVLQSLGDDGVRDHSRPHRERIEGWNKLAEYSRKKAQNSLRRHEAYVEMREPYTENNTGDECDDRAQNEGNDDADAGER